MSIFFSKLLMERFSCSNFNYLPARQLFFDMQIRGENELFSPEALNNDLLLPCCEIEQFMWLHFFPKTGQIISSFFSFFFLYLFCSRWKFDLTIYCFPNVQSVSREHFGTKYMRHVEAYIRERLCFVDMLPSLLLKN